MTAYSEELWKIYELVQRSVLVFGACFVIGFISYYLTHTEHMVIGSLLSLCIIPTHLQLQEKLPKSVASIFIHVLLFKLSLLAIKLIIV